MAGNILAGYGTSNQALTITLASLASGAGRVAAAIDNSSLLYPNVLVQGKFLTGTVSGNQQVIIYGAASADGGTTYTDNVGASNAAVVTQPKAAIPIAAVGQLATTTSYYWGPVAISRAFCGAMPSSWSVIVWNDGGGTFSATGGNHGVWYQGYYSTYT